MKGWFLLAGASLALAPSASAQTAPRADAYTGVTAWPDWGGVWSPGVGAGSRTTATPPKLTPQGQAIMDAFEAGKARGENLQTEGANCVPSGMPGIMRLPYPLEFVYSPGRVNILIETYSQVRRIYVDGRALPEDPDPAFNGHSVGRWDGDTLVIDTTGVSPLVSLVAGLKATEQTRFRERITRDGNRLVDEITITDPTLLAEPYVMTQAYTLQPEWEMREYICQENNRDGADAQGRPLMELGEDDPFAELDD
ncbi:MAG: hypothetical protein B7Z08_11515 [Sphingomonadales bacterium 32-68-7]|nr:MAG: hypothetical protein B7Z33_11720 [Sphingomonadales bacterium 12-68-11]OYX07979.1 MAG: hypothetical protein B7Z08_11515 [Sphingomonadales bacterium 32-68-7]